MSGRDPREQHRVATSLELLFDLTFVVAAAIAANEFAHAVSENHAGPGLFGFVFAILTIAWAWITFTWFASAYDTDDWAYRLATMLQMVGAIILAFGLLRMFASLEKGGHVDDLVMMAGYVLMRLTLAGQWLRAAKQDPDRRPACLTYAVTIIVAQVGWIAVTLARTSVAMTLVFSAALLLVEVTGPWIAERHKGGTPWHAHHIAERYTQFIIIALGEGMIGTVASLSAVVEDQGFTLDAVLVAVAGTGLTFGMWWMYNATPIANLLHRYREQSFALGYVNIVVFGAIVATGAGLHTGAFYIEHDSRISPSSTVLSIAVPVAVFLVAVYFTYTLLVHAWDGSYALLVSLATTVLAASVLLAAAGLPIRFCLLIIMLAPVVSVVGSEVAGHHRRAAEATRKLGHDT
ncbi:low temperature requirement protein A [Mycobacterium spongiae]|uniref:Low temperature requirement protein A n=1 Tax=Mycobacterium spongiae TaxID=886343 RepID=A0A975K191_9MYCO|nr:low temperature requirement protein A [Mycobacterium spongiae]QUR69495.1 low temperature requirement protein A [Mycobacterium spongiae]